MARADLGATLGGRAGARAGAPAGVRPAVRVRTHLVRGDRLAELWPVPEVTAALAEAAEGEPLEISVELGGIPGEVARWLNPVVLRVRRCE